jgi:lipoprotein-anchoring transpeptidase ErfK/SrfK
MRGFLVVCALFSAAAGSFAGGAAAGRAPGDPAYRATPTLAAITHPAPRRHVPPPRVAIRPHVSIAGVRVGWLAPTSAAAAVTKSFARPLPVVVDGAVVRLRPANLATPYVDGAVARAWNASSGTNVDLVVSVHGSPVRAVVARLAQRFDRASTSAKLSLSGGLPRFTPDQVGHHLDRRAVLEGIVRALATGDRAPLRFTTRSIAPAVTSADLTPVIVINRSLNRLTFFARGETRRFPVATGQAIYPTPAGRFHIVVKWKDPWWYPPTYDSWAAGLKPVPPGPGNPLGTRWMGLSVPGVGIHGTDEPGSIGYSASHGCIRMQVPDAEWLFDHVNVGTTVFIV